MNRCSKCNKLKIKELYWENGKSVLREICVNPYCKECQRINKERDAFFAKILGR